MEHPTHHTSHPTHATSPPSPSLKRQLSSTPSSTVFSKMSATSGWELKDPSPLPDTEVWSWVCCRCDQKNNGQYIAPNNYGNCGNCRHERCRECRVKWGPNNSRRLGEGNQEGGGSGQGSMVRDVHGGGKGKGKMFSFN